jgi:hypothetical protein
MRYNKIMRFLDRIWDNFKLQPDIWFFGGFLITFTLSIRKVVDFFPIKDQFNEYVGVYVYLSDIFLVLTIASWLLFILYNKYRNLSIDKLRTTTVVLPLVLVLWAFLSVFWSKNPEIAVFRSIKLLEFYLLYLYVIFRLKDMKCSTWNIFMKIIIGIGVVQAIIAMFQFVLQKSLRLFWLKESLISENIDGVAKIIFDGERVVRSYGLFPHPNILGGFLLFSIILTLLYKRVQNVPCLPVDRNSRILLSVINLIFLIQIVGLLLTFSKSAILGLMTGLIFLYCKKQETYLKRKIHLKYFFLFFSIVFLILWYSKFNFESFLFKSLDERLIYLKCSTWNILNHPFLGVGIGQSVLSMQGFAGDFLKYWQFQPVHNVFLLVWSEIGLVGMLLFVFFLARVFFKENVPRGTFSSEEYFRAILGGFIFIMFFDHYLWDIQQGQTMFWLIVGLIVSESEGNIDNIDKIA